jgi:hypothetical protein
MKNIIKLNFTYEKNSAGRLVEVWDICLTKYSVNSSAEPVSYEILRTIKGRRPNITIYDDEIG